VALWYPTAAAPTELYLRDSLAPCRLPALLCRPITFDVRAAPDAAPADGRFGLIVISHGAGGLALNHRDLAAALAARGYAVAAPNHPRGAGNDVSGVGVWVVERPAHSFSTAARMSAIDAPEANISRARVATSRQTAQSIP